MSNTNPTPESRADRYTLIAEDGDYIKLDVPRFLFADRALRELFALDVQRLASRYLDCECIVRWEEQ